MARGYTDIAPMMASRGISESPHDAERRFQLRIAAERASITIMPDQIGRLHVHADQVERFKLWLKTYSIPTGSLRRGRGE